MDYSSNKRTKYTYLRPFVFLAIIIWELVPKEWHLSSCVSLKVSEEAKLESRQLGADLQRHQTEQIERQQEQLMQQQQKIQELQVWQESRLKWQ